LVECVASSLAPDNALCYLNQCLLAFQYKQDIKAATELAKKAIEVDDRCDLAYAHLAQMYLQQGNQLEAIEAYDKGACGMLSAGSQRTMRSRRSEASVDSCFVAMQLLS